MADKYVKASGSNTSPYDTWAKAATSLATAITALAANENCYVDNAFAQTVSASTAYTPPASSSIYSTSDTTNQPPTSVADGAALTFTSASGNISFHSGSWYGFVISEPTQPNAIILSGLDNSSASFDTCTFTLGSSTNALVVIGLSTASASNVGVQTRNCSFSFGHTGQAISLRGNYRDLGSTFDSGATHPTALFKASGWQFDAELIGSDLSGNANTYWPNNTTHYQARMVNCKIHASATIQATQTVDYSGDVLMFDCDSGDNHYKFAHYNYKGNTVVSTAIYLTAGGTYDGTNHYSILVTGSANATFGLPYYSPWIDVYTDGTSAVTPYFEIVRNGSATAYKDNEVWAEFTTKVTSGSTRSTLSIDRMGLLATATNQATGAGTGAWTGLGTAWSGKCDSGASVTPAESGYIRGRIVVSTSIVVYVDPRINGLGVANQFERVTPTGFINEVALAGSSYAPPIVLQAGRRGSLY